MSYRADLEALTYKLRLAEAEQDRLRVRVAELEEHDVDAKDRALADKAVALVRLEERLAELAPVVQQAAHHRARVEVLEATVAELEATLAKRDEALARLPELEARLERLGVERLALKERLRQLEEAVRLHAKPPTELGGILTTAFVGLAFVAFTMLLAWLTTH
ncbi:MAG: hypothetical protein R3B82_16300 [Sandaracinaceae bacterium]